MKLGPEDELGGRASLTGGTRAGSMASLVSECISAMVMGMGTS